MIAYSGEFRLLECFREPDFFMEGESRRLLCAADLLFQQDTI